MYHSTLQSTPAQLVFDRYMLFNMKKEINWKLITDNNCIQIACDNKRENMGHIDHTYNVRNEVLCIKHGSKRKYSKQKSDPYRIAAVHANGTVTIEQGAKRKRMSIRNVEPYISIRKSRLMIKVTLQIWGDHAVDILLGSLYVAK